MKHLITLIAIFVLVVSACTHPTAPVKVSDAEVGDTVQPIHAEMNAVYYWKTIFRLDTGDLRFIKLHNVRRIYIRMFDVTKDDYATLDEELTVPNATVRVGDAEYKMLRDSLKDIEFVPVVYITLNALKAMDYKEGILASNIVKRVKNMCQYNAFPNVAELQLDCDWTEHYERSFFRLCDSVKQCMQGLNLTWRLSSTIRLHQLSREAPPVDNGVLMVYNTGSFDNPDAFNSIIDAKDVGPYLKHLSSYPLHLDVAYPTYSWQLLFRSRVFLGLMNGVDLSDSTCFRRRGGNVYISRKDVPYNGRIIREGDMVRSEVSEARDVIKVKNMIEKRLAGREHSNILYHLDSPNLSKYKYDEINKIFSTGR